MKNIFLILMLTINFVKSQNIKLPEIPIEFKDNANTIKLNEKLVINYLSYNKVNISKKYSVVVYNEKGYNNLDLSENYNKSNKIKKLNVLIYNNTGEKIKQFNKSDFKDNSVVDGISIFSDSRVLFLDYIPLTYPFVLEFESETESINTAFLNSWMPITNLNESILESKVEIMKNPECSFNIKEQKLIEFGIEKSELPDRTIYFAKNIMAVKPESFAKYSKELPIVKIFLKKASLEGYDFDMSSWKEFGKKYFEYFILNNSTISENTKQKLDKIIAPNDSKLTILKKVYKFVQDNTRYISIQVGVGGWKPMDVSDVEKYGYGDCKALSNYTRAILKAYNIDSYYTVIYGGEKKSFDEEIVAKQSNHVILSVPEKDSYIFLECTSQTNPFGYLGEFTSNRNALIFKPEGAEIVQTSFYKTQDNLQHTKTKVFVMENGFVMGDVERISQHTQYDNVAFLENKSPKEKLDYYKNHFDHLNNLEVNNLKFNNNKDSFSFTESFSFKAQNYYEKNGNSIILPLNVMNRNDHIPSKQRNKKFSFEIDYGYTDYDEIEMVLPQNYAIANIPENISVKDKFGEYFLEVKQVNTSVFFKRKIIINDGVYSKEDFEGYRKFREQISKNDNIKVIVEIK